MVAPVKINFKVYQGSTFRETLRWESATKNYVSITSIPKGAPGEVTLSSMPGNLPVGWRAKITGVGGMREINSDEYRTISFKYGNTLVFNELNTTTYNEYTTGGTLEYNAPINLSNYTARMQIRPTIDSDTVIASLTTENGGITIDSTLASITIVIPATVTAGYTWQTAVYGLELAIGTEVVPFANGSLTLVREVTR